MLGPQRIDWGPDSPGEPPYECTARVAKVYDTSDADHWEFDWARLAAVPPFGSGVSGPTMGVDAARW